MAIQQEIITHGLTLDTAYIKVSEINWSDQKYWGAAKQGMRLEDGTASEPGKWVNVRLTIYASKEARDNGEKLLYHKSIKMPLSFEKNWVQQAYEYLKTLDEFQGTEDV